MSRGEPPAAPTLTGTAKVRVLVQDNNVATTAGGSSLGGAKATPKPGEPPVASIKGGGESDADKYTRTTKKTLTIAVVNTTGDSIDVNVKATFLAKDEGGKHDTVPEKTVENRLTLQPNKPQQYTTEEVSFTHTAAHRPIGKVPARGRAPIMPMEPASGHAYFGYRVEVYQGNDLVGLAVSDNH